MSGENKTNLPFVSIALTTSKSEKFLRKQLDTILSQTYSLFEVCISHDECGDKTVEILEEYSLKDNRISWRYNTLQKGFIKNSEHAISMCKGDIIFLCDHDDWWDSRRIEEHIKIYTNHPEIIWVYNNSILVDEHDNVVGKIEDTMPDYFLTKKLSLLNLAWGTCMGAAHTSYRAKALKKTLPIPLFAPAHDSWIQLALYPQKSFFLDKPLYFYRQHGANQVGWAKKLSEEDIFDREKRAIKENMDYIKRLSTCPQLALWKNVFFGFVYVVKWIRFKLTKGKPLLGHRAL